ncbi:MAG: hypothetical protein ACRCUZ_13510 [Shewanella sp.]
MINPLVLEHALRRQIDIYQVPDELSLERRAEMAASIMARLIAESAGALGLPAELPDHIADTSKMVPEGWQLVPVAPTPEMMLHNSACQRHAHYDMSCPMRRTRATIWGHMLAAAPDLDGGEA